MMFEAASGVTDLGEARRLRPKPRERGWVQRAKEATTQRAAEGEAAAFVCAASLTARREHIVIEACSKCGCATSAPLGGEVRAATTTAKEAACVPSERGFGEPGTEAIELREYVEASCSELEQLLSEYMTGAFAGFERKFGDRVAALVNTARGQVVMPSFRKDGFGIIDDGSDGGVVLPLGVQSAEAGASSGAPSSSTAAVAAPLAS